MSIEPTVDRCPRCQTPVPPEAPQGLCPRCVLAGAASPTSSETSPSSGPPPSLEAIAAAFPQLELIELVGQGGMGVVYKARQPKLDRFVALKLLPQALGQDPAFAQRFNREARVLARLNHSSIVAVYDYGQTQGYFYLLMEFVDGINLRQAIQKGRILPAEALAIVPKICEALQYAHSEGVLHRDIKPENILIDTRGRVKIADFGIAKILGESTREARLTMSGAAIGTPHYMAPEQFEKPHDVDHRADIYSLGVVFYEMLTGELPIGRFAAPSEKASVDPRVDEVVFRTLEKERERRFQSAGEVKTRVEGLQSSPQSSSGHAGASGHRGGIAAPPPLAASNPASHSNIPSGSLAGWSKRAIAGAILVTISLVTATPGGLGWLLVGSYRAAATGFPNGPLPGPMPGTLVFPGWGVLLATLFGLVFTALPAITGTALGISALGEIRRAANRFRGLPLAFFAALCWPIILLDFAIMAGALMVVHRLPWGPFHLSTAAGFRFLAGSGIIAILIDVLIGLVVWRWATSLRSGTTR